MKKSIYNYFNWKVYKYASESFQLYFKGELVNLNHNDISEFGHIAITKDSKEDRDMKNWILYMTQKKERQEKEKQNSLYQDRNKPIEKLLKTLKKEQNLKITL